MQRETDRLWVRIETILTRFVATLKKHDPMLKSRIHHYSNDIFALSATAAIYRNIDATQIVVSLDFKRGPHGVGVTFDISFDPGDFIAEGKSRTIPLTPDGKLDAAAEDAWLDEFERFLAATELQVRGAIPKL